jgi:phospholipid/cholesterol/gamma-HCH transport system substrate-binding protein
MRVGALVTAALVVLMVFVFFIGSEQKIFARKNEYEARFDSVQGLAEGNPVRLSGVTIGVVKDITLPRDPKKPDVQISLMIDRKYAERIRADSRARLKKLGLLAGDSYIDITPGNPKFAVLEPGSVILAQRQTNVDQLISSGEDLVDNLVQISYSMKNILGRVDRGEGLLGELTTQPETKQRMTDTLLTTLNKTNAILAHVESGHGLMGRLVYDDKYADQLTASINSSLGSFQSIAGNIQRSFESGSGALPALLSDPEGKKKVTELVENLRAASQNLATFSSSLQSGQGLVPRLLSDKTYADQALSEFTGLVGQLNTTVTKINSGEGTAGKLLADPSVYESINDILIGINQSKLLRWLIRNRQSKGIDKRYQTDQQKGTTAPPLPRALPDSTVPTPDTAVPVVPAPPPAPTTNPAPPATDTTSSQSHETTSSQAPETTTNPPHS